MSPVSPVFHTVVTVSIGLKMENSYRPISGPIQNTPILLHLCNGKYPKDTEPLYHSFMYKLLFVTYPFHAMLSLLVKIMLRDI